MKQILYITLLITLTNCKTIQPIEYYKINNNFLKDTIMFEKFDFELAKNNYKGYERASFEELPRLGGKYFKLANGTFLKPHNVKYQSSSIFSVI